MSKLDAALAVEPKQPVRTERNLALTKGIAGAFVAELRPDVQLATYCYGNFEPNIFRRRRVSSAASAKSQSRNVLIFGFIEVAFGQTIQ